MSILFVLGAALALVPIAGWVAERLRSPVDPSQSPDPIAELPGGATRYRWSGPTNAHVVVLVHGLSTPSEVWGPLRAELPTEQYRVLSYDLYGRGFSARPGRPGDSALFVEQLRDLLRHEGVEGPMLLVGYSMGGVLAQAFAAAHPERVRGLLLLASAGSVVSTGRLTRFCRRVPVWGDAVWALAAPPVMRRSTKPYPQFPDLPKVLAREAGTRGTAPAWLSSLRHVLAQGIEAEQRAIAASGVPVIAVWGQKDTVIPISAAARMAQAIPQVETITIPEADHALAYSHPDRVAEALLKLDA